jgi:hypothetical protein
VVHCGPCCPVLEVEAREPEDGDPAQEERDPEQEERDPEPEKGDPEPAELNRSAPNCL